MSARRAYKLFVGNLPWTVSKNELSEYFGKFGNLRSASVVFGPVPSHDLVPEQGRDSDGGLEDNKTGLSKGYGFVEFSNKDGYIAAVSQNNHLLENSKLSLGLGARQAGDKQLETDDSE